jgi:carboxyl-terminal processing protease
MSDPSPSTLHEEPSSPDPVPSAVMAAPQPTLLRGLVLAATALLAGTTLFVAGYLTGRWSVEAAGTPPGEESLFAPFWDAYRAITERYAGGPVDRTRLVEGAIGGLFTALGDPYSVYLPPAAYRASLQNLSGTFEGVGVEVTARTDGNAECSRLGPSCHLVVVSPLAGSPAAEAGLRPGDVIAAVDGSSLDGLTVDEARDRIRGPQGTRVTLTIQRPDAAPFDVSLVRRRITLPEVTVSVLAGGTVTDLRVSQLSDRSAAESGQAVAAALAAGRRRFILDLRGDPGGYVTAARSIAGLFLARGTIYTQVDAAGNRIDVEAPGNAPAADPSIRLVVLVDRGTASAAEIVAAAIQDHRRGLLVGTRTFGKGTIQEWQELGPAGGFRLTVARWLTPNGRWINGTGIDPDVPVATGAESGAQDSDPVLQRALAILGG